MDENSFHLSFLAMGSSADDISGLAAKVQEMLNQMDGEIRGTLSSWTGSGKEVYEEAWKTVTGIANQMPASLAQASATLAEIHQNFSAAEQNVVNTFSG